MFAVLLCPFSLACYHCGHYFPENAGLNNLEIKGPPETRSAAHISLTQIFGLRLVEIWISTKRRPKIWVKVAGLASTGTLFSSTWQVMWTLQAMLPPALVKGAQLLIVEFFSAFLFLMAARNDATCFIHSLTHRYVTIASNAKLFPLSWRCGSRNFKWVKIPTN